MRIFSTVAASGASLSLIILYLLGFRLDILYHTVPNISITPRTKKQNPRLTETKAGIFVALFSLHVNTVIVGRMLGVQHLLTPASLPAHGTLQIARRSSVHRAERLFVGRNDIMTARLASVSTYAYLKLQGKEAGN